MAHSLILPKQTGQKDAFFASLQLYYNSDIKGEKWYSNTDFKIQIQKLLPYLSQGAQNGPYLVKQSELTRYFGLVFYDYSERIGKAHITERGKRFYNAYLQNDSKTQIDIIMESIFCDSFGRNNTAIKSSNSDVDAPKLFIKAMFDLDGISKNDLAYLLYVTHDKQVSYKDAILELRSAECEREINIPSMVSNKYSDVKFTVLLSDLGICTKEDDRYYLSNFILYNYKEQIELLSIYNKEPEIILTLSEEIAAFDELNLTIELKEDIEQKKILHSFAYDTDSEQFKKQNNRKPVSYMTSKGVKFKTNPRIAKTALEIAEYKCQIDPENHKTFTSKLGQQHMEAHHLTPMHAQKDFSENLDRVENIVSICPTCHAAIHLGCTSVRRAYLNILYNQKIEDLRKANINISFDDLFTKYYK